MISLFISLSENDKRLIFALVLVIIFLIAIIAILGAIVVSIMKWQSKKLDALVGDALYTRVVTDKKHFISYARKKNWRCFFKQAWIPAVIMLFGTLVLLIRNIACHDFSYNVFDYKTQGISTWFFVFDFEHIDKYTVTLFGWITVLKEWPALISSPHWSMEAWASYIFCPCMLVGGLWYLWTIQCLLSRTIRMYRKSRTMFDHNLDDFNVHTSPSAFTNNSNNNSNNDQNS